MIMRSLQVLFLLAAFWTFPAQGHPEVNPLSALKHKNVKVKIGELLLVTPNHLMAYAYQCMPLLEW